MKKHIDGEKLIAAIKAMMEDSSGPKVPPRSHFENMPEQVPSTEAVAADIAGSGKITAEQLEKIYREFKKRLLDELPEDPIFIHLLAARPEIILELQPRQVTIEGSSLRGRVARLIASGFFDSGKRQGECRTELERTGAGVNSGQISTLFADFVKDGLLERSGSDRYIKAAGLKVTEKVLEAVR